MNIWDWVRETKQRLRKGDARAQRLAELMQDLPSAAVDEAHERVDSMVPEALALTRDLDEPWVEVFIRHWSLQSRVLHRRRAGEELREAVALLDFASGPRTKTCPQSVCSVQDLAVCYAIRDGPGYVPERLAVARETLERIDPGWACFDCISAEYFSALMDDERPTEALAFIEGQIALAAEHGEFDVGFNTTLNRARALARLGRAEQALELLEGIHDVSRYGRSRTMTHRQARASVLLELGRVDEALALHPRLSAIIDTGGHLREWVDNLASLVEVGAVANTARVGRELLEVQRRFVASSAAWDAARTALIGARLAAARGAREVTRMLLGDHTKAQTLLRRPELLAARRREVEELLAKLDAKLDDVEEDPRDPERRLDRLGGLPGSSDELDPDVAIELASALREIGRSDQARELLERVLDDEGAPAPAVRAELAATLLAERDHAALDRLLADLADEPGDPTWLRLRWILGESLRVRGELEGAIACDRATLERAGEVVPLFMRLAANAREHGDWATALDALTRAAEHLPPGNVDWDRMTAATVLGRWAEVRAAAARLDFELEGEADDPIDDDLGLIRCEFVEPSGRRERYWARRTSPCGARIIEIAMPADVQHFRDRVVFEPSDLDAHLREEGKRHRPCFEVVAIPEPAGYRAFLLRGFDPGEALFEALREQLRTRGYGFERITNEGRSAQDPRHIEDEDAPEVATVAVLIALAPEADPAQLRRELRELSASWELPILDPELDEAAGETEAAQQSRELLEAWKP